MNKNKVIERTKNISYDQIPFFGNKFLIGNGYFGYRGTSEEFTKAEKVAWNINGLYDKYEDKWCDNINCYNPLYTEVIVGSERLNLINSQVESNKFELDLYRMTFKRITVFKINNSKIEILSSRFASFDNQHMLVMKYLVKCDSDLEIILKTGVDLDVWDLNGPHLNLLEINKTLNSISIKAQTKERKYLLEVIQKVNFESDEVVFENNKLLHMKKISLKANEIFTFEKKVYLDTSFDEANSIDETALSYDYLYQKHLNRVNQIWKISKVKIKGSLEAQLAINYSIYHLLICAPYNLKKRSMPARSLSGQVYKGAVFWDTEIFMLPFFLLTDLDLARKLVKYRIDGLKGAKEKAIEFGFSGAFYAWESTVDGIDECTLYNVSDPITNEKIRTYFKDKQVHISGDVFYGMYQYLKFSNDYSILYEGGLEMLIEICRFYKSFISFNPITRTYDVNDVTGPDEYHERVNNNAYTNRLVSFCFEKIVEVVEASYTINNDKTEEILIKLDAQILLEELKEVIISPNKIKDGVIEQFDNYFNLEDISLEELKQKITNPNVYLGGKDGLATSTQIIKQADVITMIYHFKDEYSIQEMKQNFDYYLPRTEHGSTLSHSMYSLVSSLIGDADYAYPYFVRSGLIDYYGGAKEYAGGIYIGGTHLASAGGAYMSVIYGFCGLDFKDDIPIFNPRLPKEIDEISFKIVYKNRLYKIKVNRDSVEVKEKKYG